MSSLVILDAAPPLLDVGDLRFHMRIDHNFEDPLLAAYLDAAQQLAEEVTGRAIAGKQYRLTLDDFPAGPILLPRPRCLSVDSIKYTQTDGTEGTYTGYQTDLAAEPARILPAVNGAWPETQSGAINGVRVTFTATLDERVDLVKQALRLAVGTYVENREDTTEKTLSTLPSGFERLLKGARFRSQALLKFLEQY